MGEPLIRAASRVSGIRSAQERPEPWPRYHSKVLRLAAGGGLQSRGGSTLVEAVLGTAIASVGIAGLCVANAQCLRITQAHREVLTADHCLQQRIDQFRAANWSQLTDPAAVSALMSVPPVNDDALGNHTESITITPYPAVTSPAGSSVGPMSVTRDATGKPTVPSPLSGFSLRNVTAVQINFLEGWSSSGGRTRSRGGVTVIAFGGLLPH